MTKKPTVKIGGITREVVDQNGTRGFTVKGEFRPLDPKNEKNLAQKQKEKAEEIRKLNRRREKRGPEVPASVSTIKETGKGSRSV